MKFEIGIRDRCPNPLCRSDELAIVNLTGYPSLICRDCGETIIDNIYEDLESDADSNDSE